MRKINLIVAVAIAVGFIGFTFSGSTNEVQANSVNSITSNNFLGDACKNVSIKVTNEHKTGFKIEVKKVKYYNKASGKWYTEDVFNWSISNGSSYTIPSRNLQDAEGEDLTKFVFVYRYYDPGTKVIKGRWSSDIESKEFVPNQPKCIANKTYGGGANNWTITGK